MCRVHCSQLLVAVLLWGGALLACSEAIGVVAGLLSLGR